MSETPGTNGFWSVGRVRSLSVSLLIVVLAFKLAFAEFKFDMSSFNFSDFLSLILAVSAVGLSAAFYFKADDSAKEFYNNSYNFTKDIATILGRIEVGFGEKLSTLNKGYDDINRRLGHNNSAVEDVSVVPGLNDRINSLEDKLKNSIEQVLRALDSESDDKAEAQKLRSEVESAASELGELRHRLANATKLKDYHPRFLELMRDIFNAYYKWDPQAIDEGVVRSIFPAVMSDPRFRSQERGYMISRGLIDKEMMLTDEGVDVIVSLLRSS